MDTVAFYIQQHHSSQFSFFTQNSLCHYIFWNSQALNIPVIVHTLKAINNRAPHQCHTAFVISYLTIRKYFSDWHIKGNLYSITFSPYLIYIQITFSNCGLNANRLTINGHLQMMFFYFDISRNMDCQCKIALLWRNMINNLSFPWITAFYLNLCLFKICLLTHKQMGIYRIFSLTPSISRKRCH